MNRENNSIQTAEMVFIFFDKDINITPTVVAFNNSKETMFYSEILVI